MLPRTVIVSIIDFNLFDCVEFHSLFQPLEVTRHTLLSDKMGYHFFDLKKLPDDINEKDSLLLWLSLFRAETEEDFVISSGKTHTEWYTILIYRFFL